MMTEESVLGESGSGLSVLALLHLRLLMAAQGRTDTVKLKDDCPRCTEIAKVLAS